VTQENRIIQKLFFLCILLFLFGCTYCPDEEDRYAIITNTFQADIEIQFSLFNYDIDEYQDFTEVISAGETADIYLYTWRHNDAGNIGVSALYKKPSTPHTSLKHPIQFSRTISILRKPINYVSDLPIHIIQNGNICEPIALDECMVNTSYIHTHLIIGIIP